MNRYIMDSPLGPITLTDEDGFLTGLTFDGTSSQEDAPTPLLAHTRQQLIEYFSCRRRNFSIPLKLKGTPFQKAVWEALLTIPYGSTFYYSQIAEAIRRPTAVRAVAHAIGQNPISIIVPCHRVIGKNGALTGFAWGLEVKKGLLKIEDAI